MTQVRRRSSARARAGKLAIAVGAALLVAPAVAGPSRAAGSPGFGKAQAQMLMLDPRSAQLSFGVRFGSTVADHRNTVARAQAWSTDYGLIGSAVTAEPCTGGEATVSYDDLPKPYRADSREPKDAEEKTVMEGPITQSVRAAPTPLAVATSRLAEVPLPGLMTIDGATSRTSSGVDAKGITEVRAEVDVDELSILDGIVSLGGLHWSAVNRSDTGPAGKFTLGEASLGGVPIPTQDASAVIQAVNALLSNLGIVLTPPVSHLEGETIFVDPLKVGIAPNEVRDQVAAATLGAIQPVREQLFQALLDASCDSGGAITVIDILLGSVTGGGSFSAVLGGAQAERSDSGGSVTLGGGGSTPSIGGGSPPALGGGATIGAGDGLAEDEGPGTTPGSVGTTPTREASSSAPDTSDDNAWAVALVSIVFGGALLEADRRKMSRAGAA